MEPLSNPPTTIALSGTNDAQREVKLLQPSFLVIPTTLRIRFVHCRGIQRRWILAVGSTRVTYTDSSKETNNQKTSTWYYYAFVLFLRTWEERRRNGVGSGTTRAAHGDACEQRRDDWALTLVVGNDIERILWNN